MAFNYQVVLFNSKVVSVHTELEQSPRLQPLPTDYKVESFHSWRTGTVGCAKTRGVAFRNFLGSTLSRELGSPRTD